MDEDNNPIIKNTGDINIDTTTYFQQETQNITQNGDYIYEQNENGAWHLELKPQDSTEPTDVNINISSTPIYPTITSPIENNGYYKFDGNTLVSGTDQDYNLNVNVLPTSTKINLTSFSSESGNYLFTNMITSTERTIQINYKNSMFFIRQTNSSYQLFLKTNNFSSSAINQSLENGDKYIIINSLTNYINLNDDNNNTIIKLWENDTNDRNYSLMEIYKSKFNIIF